MGTETCELRDGRAVIACDTDNKPIRGLPFFQSVEKAEGFLEFARGLHFYDVRLLTDAALEQLHATWVKSGQPEAKDEDDPGDVWPVEGAPW